MKVIVSIVVSLFATTAFAITPICSTMVKSSVGQLSSTPPEFLKDGDEVTIKAKQGFSANIVAQTIAEGGSLFVTITASKGLSSASITEVFVKSLDQMELRLQVGANKFSVFCYVE